MKAVFLDRDGTLNEDAGYVHHVEDLVVLSGVVEGLRKLQSLGFALFIVTNQSGVGRGYFTLKQLQAFTDALRKRLEEAGVRIEKTYFCPHTPDEGCACRKPGTKMLEDAEQEFGVSLADSYVIGDMASDVELGRKAGCTTIFLQSGRDEDGIADADFIADDFQDAVAWIESLEKQKN